MIRIKYHAPGTAPATLVPSSPAAARGSRLSLIQYDAEGIFEGEFDTFEELAGHFDPKKVNWINVDGLSDVPLLRRIAERFHIHPLALEDVLNTTQRPKVEQYADHFFIVSEMICPDGPSRIAVSQLSLFLGSNYLLTVQEESAHDVFRSVRARLRAGRGYARSMKADYLAYALLDATVDQFYPLLETVGDGIEAVEEELLDKPSRAALRKLYNHKRLLLHLRRAAWPQREIFNALIRDDSGLIMRETQVFLRDCYDHVSQIIDLLENFRDLSAGLMDLYLSSLGFRTNEIMRVLTVVSVMFIPLNFLAGVFGLNFDTSMGHAVFWVLCVLTLTGMFVFFRKRGWV